MDITPDKYQLLTLVERARKGEIVLPQFQRNFVWSRDDIADLLLSVLKGYFIGSFLFLEADSEHKPFAIRALEGIDLREDQIRPARIVLDGQQRLTSLHYAMAAPNIPLRFTKRPYRFFLNLRKLLTWDEDGLIVSFRDDQCGSWLERETQFKKWILPFTEISNWTNWKDAYEDWLFDTDRDEHQCYREERRGIWNDALDGMNKFQVPYVQIPKVREGDQEGLSEVCAIFEKLNSTGVKLSVYDLLTARLYKYGIDLHTLWEKAVEDNVQLAIFSNGSPDTYGIFVLRIIALLRKQEVRAKTLVNLSPEKFEEDWEKAVVAIEKALDRVASTNQDGFGVFDLKWQPYSTLIPGLAVLLHNAEKQKVGHEVYADIKCWYWGSVFLERYAGAVESTTYRDTMDLVRRQKEPEFVPEAFKEIRTRLSGFSLLGTSRVNSVYRGVMNLIAIKGARDFLNNDSISFHELEDHHIFPKAYLRDKLKIEKGDQVNTILNRTLIVSGTNKKISRKSPSKYLEDIIPVEHKEAILHTHLIGSEAQKAMEQDDYDIFVLAREQEILTFLKTYLEPAVGDRD